jgi:hypothetical protein
MNPLRRLWLLWRLRATVAEIQACEAAGIDSPMVREWRRLAQWYRDQLKEQA